MCTLSLCGEEFSGSSVRKKDAELDMIAKALIMLINKGALGEGGHLFEMGMLRCGRVA